MSSAGGTPLMEHHLKCGVLLEVTFNDDDYF
jgi:hypothetical protein